MITLSGGAIYFIRLEDMIRKLIISLLMSLSRIIDALIWGFYGLRIVVTGVKRDLTVNADIIWGF